MRRHQATQGATMIVVVLFTLLLLAGILAATLQLSLGSRQNTADQAATLRAQYAAESMAASATLRVREIQALLSAASISVPANTLSTELKTYAERYCGNTTWTDTVVDGNTVSTCKVTQNAAGNDQFGVFAAYVSNDAYRRILPVGEVSDAGTTSWWKARLGQDFVLTNGDSSAKLRIQPTKVEKFEDNRFRFYLKLTAIKARGNAPNTARYLLGQGIQNGEWWIEVARPPFLDNVLFTNFHRSQRNTIPGFDEQAFDGPIHTNEKFKFYQYATASFRKVSSAGCTNLSSLPTSATTCNREAGAYVNSTLFPAPSGTPEDKQSASVQEKVDDYTDVNWNGKSPNFRANYRPMPVAATTQRADAQNGGLYLGSSTTVNGIRLWAGDSSGNLPADFNATTRKWSNPVPTYQYITVNPNDSAPTKVEYRYASNRQLQKKVNGVWQNVTNRANFNGVIFSETSIGYTSNGQKYGGLVGPGGSYSGWPALAPFAQMTVASQQDIYISGHLKMSEEPRVCTEGAADFQACRADASTRKNVLGIYAQGSSSAPSDISVTWDAPNNLSLQAMIMTSTGEMNVQYHDSGDDRGAINLIGGLVENYYGAFGTIAPSGYGRNFKYDRRFLDNPGFGPPSFPISPVWEPKDASTDEDTSLPLAQRIRLDRFTWEQGDKASY